MSLKVVASTRNFQKYQLSGMVAQLTNMHNTGVLTKEEESDVLGLVLDARDLLNNWDKRTKSAIRLHANR